MSEVLTKLKAIREQLTKNEVKIAEFILDNLDEIKNLNTYDLGEKCGVSQASVVRFSKKLGFSGFPEFKIALSSDMGRIEGQQNETFIRDAIKIDDDSKKIAKKVVFENIDTIEDTYKLIDFAAIDKAVEIIDKSKRIFILGVAFSGLTAKDLQYKLLELGKSAIYEGDIHIQFSNISTIGEGDAVFVISQGGKTLDIFNLLKEVKRRGVPIISLTKFSQNPIRDIADIKLNTALEKKSVRPNALSSRISQLLIIDVIYIKLIQKNRELAEKYIGDAIELVKEMKIN